MGCGFAVVCLGRIPEKASASKDIIAIMSNGWQPGKTGYIVG